MRPPSTPTSSRRSSRPTSSPIPVGLWLSCESLAPNEVANTLPAPDDQTTLAGPTSTSVVLPNDDTLYSTAFLDVAAGPVTLSGPSVRGRYVDIQLLDMYTNTFADIGVLTDGGHSGTYAVVAPTGTGPSPPGRTRSKRRLPKSGFSAGPRSTDETTSEQRSPRSASTTSPPPRPADIEPGVGPRAGPRAGHMLEESRCDRFARDWRARQDLLRHGNQPTAPSGHRRRRCHGFSRRRGEPGPGSHDGRHQAHRLPLRTSARVAAHRAKRGRHRAHDGDGLAHPRGRRLVRTRPPRSGTLRS